MEFRVANGSAEKLTGLRVQMCVMLAGLTGFDGRTNDNKVFAAPFAACKDATGKRWIITGWERCGRAWGNPPCPCLHADPVVEDCPPGADEVGSRLAVVLRGKRHRRGTEAPQEDRVREVTSEPGA